MMYNQNVIISITNIHRVYQALFSLHCAFKLTKKCSVKNTLYCLPIFTKPFYTRTPQPPNLTLELALK